MNLGNTASAVMDKLCGCCCANWCERLRHTDSATAIVPRVKAPSQSDTRWKRLSSGRRATTSPPSPLGSAELLRVQPGLDPYYSDDDASTSSEGSAKVPDGTSPIKRAASMRRPRPDEQFANPNDESRKRSSSMSGASPSTLTVPSPVDSRRRRSFENFRMCDLGEIRPELYVMEDAQTTLDKTQSPSKDDANEEAYGILSFSVRYEESTQR
ncbi:uncharacterized protein LOC121432241 isoform X1 [Lytechinus variegatus]|uniref:uncharacterized protein LOC121432241 isoform X1 n=1 Tax=Lytechinus variegatus TaxID=7654 RepID=UPI001BB280D0|nr:uncharacterized protein LOC121432241 isoform X1 [Lytechinus variegatus]